MDIENEIAVCLSCQKRYRFEVGYTRCFNLVKHLMRRHPTSTFLEYKLLKEACDKATMQKLTAGIQHHSFKNSFP